MRIGNLNWLRRKELRYIAKTLEKEEGRSAPLFSSSVKHYLPRCLLMQRIDFVRCTGAQDNRAPVIVEIDVGLHREYRSADVPASVT